MTIRLARSRRFRLCIACHQLILPGELYADQRWAPWECEDGSWWSQPACRWCSEGYWKANDGDGWSDDWAQAWVDEQPGRWLEGFDCFEPVGPRWGRPVRDEFTEPLETAQKQARAFMAFLRRFAKGARAATVRRVGSQLLDIGFQRPPLVLCDVCQRPHCGACLYTCDCGRSVGPTCCLLVDGCRGCR